MRSRSRSAALALASALVLALAAGAADRGADGDPPLAAGSDFGAGLSLKRISPLGPVLREPERFEARPLLLQGRISDVCQKKGCWTVLSQGPDSIRVRFEDYGFFLPTDCSGKQAYVEGRVVVETLSEKQARHYASESRAANPDEIHGPQREVGFIATGVRLIGDD